MRDPDSSLSDIRPFVSRPLGVFRRCNGPREDGVQNTNFHEKHWSALGCTQMNCGALGCIGMQCDALGCSVMGCDEIAIECIGIHGGHTRGRCQGSSAPASTISVSTCVRCHEAHRVSWLIASFFASINLDPSTSRPHHGIQA